VHVFIFSSFCASKTRSKRWSCARISRRPP